jgi:hypothetical protein
VCAAARPMLLRLLATNFELPPHDDSVVRCIFGG